MDSEQINKKIKDIDGIIPRDIHINRVPPKTFKRFKELAKEEFCFDYGMTMKHLLDFYDGIIGSGLEHLEAEIELLREDVEALKVSNNKEKETSIIKMLNGREIRRKK